MEYEEDVVFSGIGDRLQHISKHSKGDAVNVYFAKTTFNWMNPSVIDVSYEPLGGYMSPDTTGVVVRTKTIFSEEEKKRAETNSTMCRSTRTYLSPSMLSQRPMR